MDPQNRTDKKQPRKGLQERQDRILEAATEIFAEKGIDHATIDDIAARAGVGKGTVYRRVGKKKDFVNLLFQRAAKSTFDIIESEIRKRKDPLLQFKEAINTLCDIYEKDLNTMMLLLSRLTLYIKSGDIEKPLTAHKDIFRLMEGILQKAINKGQIRSIDTVAVVKGIFYFLNPYFYQYLRFKCNYTKGEVAQLTIDLFLNGLRIRS